MELLIALEHRFDVTPDGCTWTQGTYPRPYWERYLRVFDSVTVVARAREVRHSREGMRRVDGGGVRVLALPHYVGPREFAKVWISTRRGIRKAIQRPAAVILRVPGNIGNIAASTLVAERRPFGVEVVGDPWDVFAPGATDHLLRPLFRRWFARALRQQCVAASSVLYVTRESLQRRYPASARVAGSRDVFVASNVEMPERAYLSPLERRRHADPKRIRFLCVAGMDQPYKGHKTLICALSVARRRGMGGELVLVGDGRLRGEFESTVDRLGLRAAVTFLGQMPAGESVRAELDRADVFVLPSLVEGLPRALVEAMGRSLPCIGTRVGGIPEVLPDRVLVDPGSVEQLAAKMGELAADAVLRRKLGADNWVEAQRYSEAALAPCREAFYRSVAEAAAQYMKASNGHGGTG